MKYNILGHTGLKVSQVCLGTMTWGKQNTEHDAFSQLDHSFDAGINFIDTAEMYPVPNEKEHVGKTEEIIGKWFSKNNLREKIILATKVSGPGGLAVPREGKASLDESNIKLAIDASLKRLKTDYIDLYQVHWPSRPSNYFGTLGYSENREDVSIPIEETLFALNNLIIEGKIRSIGVSNETSWGLLEYLRLAEKYHLPNIVSIQNPYNLLNRSFEVGLAEISLRENIGLLAYSPLAFGVLSGKYLDGNWPNNARLTLFRGFKRYLNEQSHLAVKAYINLANNSGLDPSQMALAWVNSRPFVASNIIGATNMNQLKVNLDSININLSDDVIEELEKIHSVYTYPNP